MPNSTRLVGDPQRLARFQRMSWLVLAALLVFAAFFLMHVAHALPPVVASHFNAAGRANGFMSRDGYIIFMVLITFVFPLGLVGLLAAVCSAATTLKLPHREYWMAPPRRAQTRAFLLAHGMWLGSLLVAFMCYVHLLVADANRLQPPHLSTPAILLGLVAFALAMLTWVATLARAFAWPP